MFKIGFNGSVEEHRKAPGGGALHLPRSYAEKIGRSRPFSGAEYESVLLQ